MPKSEATAEPVTMKNGQLRWPECTYMDGMEIMNFALSEVPPLVEETLELAGWQKEEIGLFAMHQANKMILEFLAKRIGTDREHMPITMEEMGNTVSASVPLMLTEKHGEIEARGGFEKVLICGFGIGLSWGAVTADLSKTKIFDTWII